MRIMGVNPPKTSHDPLAELEFDRVIEGMRRNPNNYYIVHMRENVERFALLGFDVFELGEGRARIGVPYASEQDSE